MKVIFTLHVFFLLQFTVFASSTDSLFIALKNADNKTKLVIYEELCVAYYSISLDSSGIFAKKKLSISQNLNNAEQIAVSYKLLGNVCFFKGEYQQALGYYKRVISIAEKNMLNELSASALNNIGMIHYELGNYDKAIENYWQVIKIDSADNNLKGVGSTLNNIGNIYLNQSKYYDAITYYKKSLRIAQELNDKIRIISAYNNLGLAYHWLSDFDNTSKYYFLALKSVDKIKDNNTKISILINIGSLYEEWDDLQKALTFFTQANKLSEKILYKKGIVQTEENIGTIYNELQKPDSAITFFVKAIALAKEAEMTSILSSIYINIGKSYELKKNFNKAKQYYQMSFTLRKEYDNSDDIASSLNSLGKVFLLLKDYNNALKYVEQSNQYAIYSNTKLSNYKLLSDIYEALNKPITAFRYYKVFSAMKDSVFSVEKHKQIQELQTKYETEKKEETIIKLSKEKEINNLKNQKSKYILFSMIFVLVGIVVIGILIFRQNKLKAKHTAIELEQKLLRTQMNPHFIFNSISSIQDFIMTNNPLEASSYLSDFAKLMRATLTNSSDDFITLEKEIETIENYLKLQHLRLSERFDYKIILPKDFDAYDYSVPPMLLQPFIENSIIHGFKNKTDGKGLITISYKLENNFLIMETKDNGIGRQKSATNKNPKHISKAGGITEQRIELLSKKFKQNIDFEIIDLKDNQKSSGTLVRFKLPLI